jgi:hypothetical protein
MTSIVRESDGGETTTGPFADGLPFKNEKLYRKVLSTGHSTRTSEPQ